MATKITGVWLRREGGESDPKADAVVLLEIDGRWVEVIRERAAGNFSHICEEGGIRKADRLGQSYDDLAASGGIAGAP